MQEKYLILFLLSFLPFIYKYGFWLYVVQLKEYRVDRLKEYFTTKQWKNSLYNNWLFIEFPVLIFSIGYFINPLFEWVLINVIILFLLIESLFVWYKFFKNNIYLPKLTARLLISILLLLVILFIYYYLIDNIYFFILSSIIFTLFFILFAVFLSLPLVNYLKWKKIRKAIHKTKKKNKPIKVWITWSYWKSSVKEYLTQILEHDWLTLSTPKNINTELWISDLIINKLKNKYKYFVAEMWAYKIWEIDLLWKIVNHKYWFLTAIWNQHLALFWWIDNTIIGKSEISNSVLKNDWILYINWDSKEIKKAKFNKKLNIVKYWLKWKANAKSIITEETINNTKFIFLYKWKEHKYITNLVWKHNILNLTWILAFCYDIWIDNKIIKKSLKNLSTPENTQKIIKTKKHIIIDDTYNLSQEWLFAWLEVLQKYESKNWLKILIIDDILELWEQSENIIKKIWKKIWEKKLVDKVFYVWVNYNAHFINWLIKWWFNSKNIINNINQIKKHDIVLLEWRKSWKYLKILTWEEQ